jgi:hypothetical protein
MIVYVVMMAVVWIGKPWDLIPAGYITKTTAVFCFIYLISLFIVAGWNHLKFIIDRGKHIVKSKTVNKAQESEQASDGAQ